MTQIPYSNLVGLEHIYLEDSYVLNIVNPTTYELELVLCESHPQYKPPLEGEQYCYKKVILKFPNSSFSDLRKSNMSPVVDSDGSHDYGNIDIFYQDEDKSYYMQGDWGNVRIQADPPIIQYGDNSM